MDFQKVINEMSVTILENIKRALDNEMSANKSFKGKIIEKVNDYKYKVLYSGDTYTVSSNAVCSIGDIVRVCVPNNNWQDLFILTNNTSANREITDEYLYSQVTSNTADIERLEQQIAELGETGDLAEAIEKAQTTADGAQIEVDAVEEDVSALQSSQSTLEDTIGNAQKDITALQDNQTAMQQDIKNIQTNISTLQTNVVGVQSDVTNLENEMDTLQDDVTSLRDIVENSNFINYGTITTEEIHQMLADVLGI